MHDYNDRICFPYIAKCKMWYTNVCQLFQAQEEKITAAINLYEQHVPKHVHDPLYTKAISICNGQLVELCQAIIQITRNHLV